jgi:chaperonin GroES
LARLVDAVGAMVNRARERIGASCMSAGVPNEGILRASRRARLRARANKEAVVISVRPLNDRIVVKRVASETKTKGGIIIPDTAQEKPIEGLVVAVGPGAVRDDGSRREPVLKVGDRVLFQKYGGTEVKLEDEEHLILRESDVLGVIE